MQMTPEQQTEALALLVEFVKRNSHARDCALQLHREHGKQVFRGPRTGKFGREIPGAYEAYKRDLEEFNARAPKCNCFAGRAADFVDQFQGAL